MSDTREVMITGFGIVSTLGDGNDETWTTLTTQPDPAKRLDRELVAPYPLHHVGEIDFASQIPKRGDQRQMELWQRLGVYAAGLALDDAGTKEDTELLGTMDMIVAADGGERDIEVDETIFSELPTSNNRDAHIIERLSNDLRPTLFLAQLPNLVAGNISIVHGVTGSSRTFMGEESSGLDAVRTGHARISAGQSKICLVGGTFNGAREDMIALFVMGDHYWDKEFKSVWSRNEADGGLIFGSMASFLVLEEAEHAKARGATPIARLNTVKAGRNRREPGQITQTMQRLWNEVPEGVRSTKGMGVFSGATGIAPAVAEEQAFLDNLDGTVGTRGTGTLIGHGLEAQFPTNLALATLCLQKGMLYPALDDPGSEDGAAEAIDRAMVTSVGHWRGEGLAIIEKV